MEFSGKTAFVTGAANGIGLGICRALARNGVNLVLADIEKARLEAAREELAKFNVRTRAIEVDVSDAAAYARAADEAEAEFGNIHFLFNNAGIGVGGEVDSYTLDDWNDVFDVNLRGVVHGIQAVYPIMIRQHSGHIVNTASLAGLVTSSGTASYSATKHAVVGLSKVLRVEAERHGVQVSVLCPGAIRTPILTMGKYGRYDGVSDEQLLKFWEPFRPMAPEKFAERALRAVLRGDAIIVVPAWWKALWYLERISPALSMRVAKVPLKRLRGLESTTS